MNNHEIVSVALRTGSMYRRLALHLSVRWNPHAG